MSLPGIVTKACSYDRRRHTRSRVYGSLNVADFYARNAFSSS